MDEKVRKALQITILPEFIGCVITGRILGIDWQTILTIAAILSLSLYLYSKTKNNVLQIIISMAGGFLAFTLYPNLLNLIIIFIGTFAAGAIGIITYSLFASSSNKTPDKQ